MPRHALAKLLLVSAATLPLAACSSTVRMPRLAHPGSAPQQRASAEAYDPYPLPDLGPPIDGGRPREFSKPRNEVERSQDFLRSAGARPAREVQRTTPIAVGTPIPVGASIPVGAPMTAPPVAPGTPLY